MDQPVYRRVLLKLSGEALAGEKRTGLDFAVIGQVCGALKAAVDMGVQIGLVTGGGNFWRGARNSGGKMDRTRADQMGMLATVMNSLAVADVCEQKGIPVRMMTALEMPAVGDLITRRDSEAAFRRGELVVFAGGTGSPYFTTDTTAVLRAAEIGADVILLAKNIDGVYSADPAKDPAAVKYDAVSYDEVLAKRLGVMDLTATSMAMENRLPVLVFALKDPENILRALRGEKVGTLVGERA
ncbi:MAG: UMP kinase [Oscillibacter sp.]|nr:UMP kinase [Oscillibacter sp.]